MRVLQPVASRPRDAVTASRYRLLVELGHGGMADVYLSVQLGTAGFRRLAVLKRLRPHLAEDNDFLEMFLQEARLAARLSHPNVVHTHEVGHDGECHFMAMEYLRGNSYQQVLGRIGREHFDFAHSVRVLIEALKGLEYAHNLKDFDGTPLEIVHRDISPSNIFVTYDGQIKILDFGIAKALNSSVETKAGVLKGKVSYMSPEQASGEHVDLQTDLYAIGVQLWEAAAGRRRWLGMPEVAVLRKLMLREPPTPPHAAARGLPSVVDDICMRSLAANPKERYASAGEFREALERLLDLMGRRVSAEDVGRHVADRFREDREQLQAKVEEELKRLQKDEDLTLSSLVQTVSHSKIGPIGGSSEPVLGGSTHSEFTQEPTQSLPGTTKRGSRVALAIAVMAVVGGSAALVTMRPEAPAPVVAAVPPTPAPPRTVSIRITAQPPHARLLFDGKPLSGNPHVVELPRASSSVVVRAEATGYSGQSTSVALDSDRTVELVLAPLPPEPEQEKEPARQGARRRYPRQEPVAETPPAPPQQSAAPAPAAPRRRNKGTVTLDTANPWEN